MSPKALNGTSMASFKSLDDLKIELLKLGFNDLKDKTRKSVIMNLAKGADRIGALEEVAKKLKNFGGKYNPTGGQSSVGRSEFTGGFTVEAKIKGGGGSGAGSDLTKLTESAQCVYCASHFNGGGYSHNDLKKYNRDFDVDERLDNILKKLPDDWIESSRLIAEFLRKKFPNKKYVFHRGSEWVSTLEKHWKKLNDDADKPFSNLNKWSPADIWMISTAGERVDITKTKTLIELNELLIAQYRSGDIVGVSLKKVRGRASYKELNMDQNRKTFKFEKTTTGLRDFFSSGDAYLFFDGGKAQFRKFGSTWQGELKGENANMGKISGGPIQKILELQLKKKFTPQRELSIRNDETINQFYEWYNMVPYHQKIDKSDFHQQVSEKDMNWYVSKILSTQFVAIVENMTKKEKDELASALVNYAASESVLSGPFIKVY